jgi:hypothetical protein
MNRHFYISNDLNDLEQIELELEKEAFLPHTPMY